jgi:hypothetical protein
VKGGVVQESGDEREKGLRIEESDSESGSESESEKIELSELGICSSIGEDMKRVYI